MMLKYRPYCTREFTRNRINYTEQREILLKFLDAAAKLSALGVSKAENSVEPWMLQKILHRYQE
jgi:hypothetical protein